MRNLLLILCFFLTNNLWANEKGYELKIEMMLKGKAPFISQLNIKDGEKGFVKNNETYFEVTPSEAQIQGRNGILLKFTIGSIGKDGKELMVISRPEILVGENKQAKITIGDDKKKGVDLSLVVIAKKIAL